MSFIWLSRSYSASVFASGVVRYNKKSRRSCRKTFALFCFILFGSAFSHRLIYIIYSHIIYVYFIGAPVSHGCPCLSIWVTDNKYKLTVSRMHLPRVRELRHHMILWGREGSMNTLRPLLLEEISWTRIAISEWTSNYILVKQCVVITHQYLNRSNG